jgi:hypothetical protein
LNQDYAASGRGGWDLFQHKAVLRRQFPETRAFEQQPLIFGIG